MLDEEIHVYVKSLDSIENNRNIEFKSSKLDQ